MCLRALLLEVWLAQCHDHFPAVLPCQSPCSSAVGRHTSGRLKTRPVCVAMGLLHSCNMTFPNIFILSGLLLIPQQEAWEPSRLLRLLSIVSGLSDLQASFGGRGDGKGSTEMNVNINRTVEKMFYVFVKDLSLCCQETHYTDIADLFNCNSLLIALFRSYVDFN